MKLVLSFELITDSGFDEVGTWNITPAVGLCRGWCHSSDVWREPARSGLNFIFANPEDGSLVVSQRVSPSTDKEPYNRCDLQVYLRVVNPLDSQVVVLWDSTQYFLDLAQWEKDSEINEGEWTASKLLLYGSSKEIEFRLQTMSITFISMDDVTLDCYSAPFYENLEFTFFLGLIIVAVFITLGSILARVITIEARDFCCCCCQRTPKFEAIIIEESPADETTDPIDGVELENLNNLAKAFDPDVEARSKSNSSSSSPETVVTHE